MQSSSLVADVGGQQRGTGLDRQLRRAGRHSGGLAEEVDLHTGSGEVPLGHQAHHPVVPQPFGEHLERAGRSPPVSGSTSKPRLSRYSRKRGTATPA